MSLFAQLPDGRKLEFPDGTSPEVMQSTVKKMLGVAPDAKPRQSASQQIAGDHITRGAQQVLNTTPAELAMGSAPGRFVQGMGDIGAGALQLVSNLNPVLMGIKALGGPDVAGRINEAIDTGQQMTQRGREAQGSEGFDWTRLAGNVVSPANVLGMRMLTKAPATFGGQVAQGAGIGGAYGASMPVQNAEENFVVPKAAQTAGGIVIGGAIPAVGAVANKGYELARNFMNPNLRVGQTLNALAGDDQAAIISALRKPQQGLPGETITAAEAALPVGRREFSAAQELIARQVDPSGYGRVASGNQQARAAMLPTTDPTITGAMRATLEAERDAATRALRQDALSQANVAGQVLPGLQRRASDRGAQAADAVSDVRRFAGAEQRAQDAAANWVPVPGMPRVSGRYSRAEELAQQANARMGDEAGMSLQRGAERRFADMQARSVAESGHFPLQANSIQAQVNRISKDPSLGPSDIVSKSMRDLQTKLAEWTDANGVIDSRALYTIRKELANSIKKYADETKNWDQRLTGKLQQNIQSAIDDAIEGAGGTGWRDYLRTYSEKSKPLEQLDLGGRLAQALTSATGKERPTLFAGAVRNASDEIGETMNATQQQRIADVLRSITREGTQRQYAQEGRESAGRILTDLAEPPVVPGWFSPVVTALKKGLHVAKGKATEDTLKRAAEVMRTDPKRVADLMESAAKTPAQRAEIQGLVRALQQQTSQQQANVIGSQEAR